MVKGFDEKAIKIVLKDLPLSSIRCYRTIGSTNDEAIAWAGENAPDMSLVIADEQTSGRGRNTRKWYSSAGKTLSFSVILRLNDTETQSLSRFSALGALSVIQAINEINADLDLKIKWPNDVLINGLKVCGILAETVWKEDRIENLVIGIGVNIYPGSVPPVENLNFPATSLQDQSECAIDRLDLLERILKNFLVWRKQIDKSTFIDAWTEKLAFIGEEVIIWSENSQPRIVAIIGLNPDGGLRIKERSGKEAVVHYGELHLKPLLL